jgi:hypothetical protein
MDNLINRALWPTIFVLTGTLALSGCTLEDRVLGNDFAAFEDGDAGDVGADADADPGTDNCDMSGQWIAELRTESLALGLTATSFNTYYYEIEDTGDEITVTRGWDCSFVVRGVTSVDTGRTAREALAQLNRQDGTIDAISEPPVTVAPRTGIFRPSDDNPDTCEFSMERWWSSRGGAVSLLPPREEYNDLDISDMEARNPAPTAENPEGQRDIDNDGDPGVKLEVTKPLVGTRDSYLRDWNQLGPFEVERGATDFTGVADFNNQENIFQASNSLLLLNGAPKDDGHSVRFHRIDEKAPTDIEEFITWCEDNVDAFFVPEREL